MSKITVIGGARQQITANALDQIMAEQENEGEIFASFSGTGHNIAENLGRIGADVAFVSAAGDDFSGRALRQEMEKAGVNTRFLRLEEGQRTAARIEVLNIIGDPQMIMNDETVYGCITEETVDEAEELLNASEFLCVDGSLSEEVLRHLTETVKAPLFLDPHREEDAEKVRDFIGAFDMIKPNRGEASVLCGKEIFSEEQLKEAGKWFADQGVKRIFITMSGGGVYYKEGDSEGILRPNEMLPMQNERGAGDAFSAAVLDGAIRGMAIRELAAYGMKAAEITLGCREVVNPDMSREKMKAGE